jgi:16S rRNA G1207 methylase RsmC
MFSLFENSIRILNNFLVFVRRVGQVLHKWTSGKIPKAFKIIPALKNWEEVLFLTDPGKWSANAMYAATKLFASNLNPKLAQRYRTFQTLSLQSRF